MVFSFRIRRKQFKTWPAALKSPNDKWKPILFVAEIVFLWPFSKWNAISKHFEFWPIFIKIIYYSNWVLKQWWPEHCITIISQLKKVQYAKTNFLRENVLRFQCKYRNSLKKKKQKHLWFVVVCRQAINEIFVKFYLCWCNWNDRGCGRQTKLHGNNLFS